MNKQFIILILCLCILAGLAKGNGIQNRSENFIVESCGEDMKFDYKKFPLAKEIKSGIERECGQKFFQDEVIYWEIEKDDELKYIAVIDNVYGKSLPITFLVIFNLDGSIHRSTIIKYREEHGGEVASENWISQFNGRNKQSSYDVGDDIQAISGATISVNSVTRGIKKLTLLFPEIKSHNGY